MADVLLVHGSGHGAWCWRDVVPALAARGHEVRAIDLPGLGADRTPVRDATLDACVERIGAHLGDRTVLVGHSLGGISITQAGAAFPDRIARLVYVAAWVPGDGQSARDLRRAFGCEALMAATRVSEDGLTSTFDPAAVPDLLYHDCPGEAVAYALPRLRPQPISVGNTPVRLADAGRAPPRSYVRCLADRAIPPAAQIALSDDWDDVHDMTCGHSPFFAAPDRLADILNSIAEDA